MLGLRIPRLVAAVDVLDSLPRFLHRKTNSLCGVLGFLSAKGGRRRRWRGKSRPVSVKCTGVHRGFLLAS